MFNLSMILRLGGNHSRTRARSLNSDLKIAAVTEAVGEDVDSKARFDFDCLSPGDTDTEL